MTQTIKDEIARLEEAFTGMTKNTSDLLLVVRSAKAHLKLLKSLESGEVRIVPLQPTKDMLDALEDDTYGVEEDYLIMIEAAPEYSFDDN